MAGGEGNDLIYGGTENDYIYGQWGDDTIFGGAGNDTLLADNFPGDTRGDDLLYGGRGNDLMDVALGFDRAYGGRGNDKIIAAIDTAYAPPAAPSLFSGGRGFDALTLSIELVSDTTQAGDHLVMTADAQGYALSMGGVAVVMATGFERLDLTISQVGYCTLKGGAGVEVLTLQAGDVHVATKGGDDVVVLTEFGKDVLYGGAGTDLLVLRSAITLAAPMCLDVSSGSGLFLINGVSAGKVAGFETYEITGSQGADVFHLGEGNDRIEESTYWLSGNDLQDGGGGDDHLYGGTGYDTLIGGTGDDNLFGGNGLDRLIGGLGTDTMYGGAGPDIFIFTSLADSGTVSGQIDIIREFSVRPGDASYDDRIDLSAIDAMPGTATHDALQFIGSGEFTTAGQVRVVQVGPTAYLEINTVDNAGAEMAIALTAFSAATFGAEDLIL